MIVLDSVRSRALALIYYNNYFFKIICSKYVHEHGFATNSKTRVNLNPREQGF